MHATMSKAKHWQAKQNIPETAVTTTMKTRVVTMRARRIDTLIWTFPYHLLISMGVISAVQQSYAGAQYITFL